MRKINQHIRMTGDVFRFLKDRKRAADRIGQIDSRADLRVIPRADAIRNNVPHMARAAAKYNLNWFHRNILR